MRAFSYACSLPLTLTKMAVTPFDMPYPKPHAVCKHHGTMFVKTGVIADRSFTLWEKEFGFSTLLGIVTLTLTQWPSYMNTDLMHSAWRSAACADMNFIRQGFRKFLSDRHAIQTHPKLYTMLLCRWWRIEHEQSALFLDVLSPCFKFNISACCAFVHSTTCCLLPSMLGCSHVISSALPRPVPCLALASTSITVLTTSLVLDIWHSYIAVLVSWVVNYIYLASVVAPITDEIVGREYNTSDVIICSAEGVPAPSVTWTRISGSMPETATSSGMSQAVLRNLKTGVHTWLCTARNQMGSDNRTVTFTGKFDSVWMLRYSNTLLNCDLRVAF